MSTIAGARKPPPKPIPTEPKPKSINPDNKSFAPIKLNVRLLPPDLSEQDFLDQLSKYSAILDDSTKSIYITSYYYVQGAYSSKPFEEPAYSRAYFLFRNQTYVDQFLKELSGKSFTDPNTADSFIPQISRALYKSMPVIKEKNKASTSSLGDDFLYKAFLKCREDGTAFNLLDVVENVKKSKKKKISAKKLALKKKKLEEKKLAKKLESKPKEKEKEKEKDDSTPKLKPKSKKKSKAKSLGDKPENGEKPAKAKAKNGPKTKSDLKKLDQAKQKQKPEEKKQKQKPVDGKKPTDGKKQTETPGKKAIDNKKSSEKPEKTTEKPKKQSSDKPEKASKLSGNKPTDMAQKSGDEKPKPKPKPKPKSAPDSKTNDSKPTKVVLKKRDPPPSLS